MDSVNCASGFANGGRKAAMDRATEKIVRAIYEAIAKEQVSVDWSWVKREAESQLVGKSPSGRVGMSIQEGLKKAGKLRHCLKAFAQKRDRRDAFRLQA